LLRALKVNSYILTRDNISYIISLLLKNDFTIQLFSDVGIYDYTNFLAIDFYQGIGTIYLRYLDDWRELGDNRVRVFEVSGYGTTEIIFKILDLTIFSGRRARRDN